jgi:Ni/Fe-hydrogenase subunit HybB-like protein
VRAYLADLYFVFFAYGDWAVSSGAFVFGVSWASLSRTDPAFSPLFYKLMAIVNVSRSLSITHKIRKLARAYSVQPYFQRFIHFKLIVNLL